MWNEYEMQMLMAVINKAEMESASDSVSFVIALS
jgi:hypothetical protein